LTVPADLASWGVVDLAVEELVGADGAPARWLVLTHGIYGSGGNWRSIGRRLVAARPGWGVALVDLRGHGRSPPGAAPHDLAACAADVDRVIDRLEARAPVAAVAGHSFGGKVMLALRQGRAGRSSPAQTWVLDASPSARPDALGDPDNSVVAVLRAIEDGPSTWPDRAALVAHLGQRGIIAAVAQWFAMNLVPAAAGYRLRLDPAQLRALLSDYFARDLWSAIDPVDAAGTALPGVVHVVVGDRSPALSPADRARLARLQATPGAGLTVHHLDAGHWLNADDPDAVVALLAATL
jgi:esterase